MPTVHTNPWWKRSSNWKTPALHLVCTENNLKSGLFENNDVGLIMRLGVHVDEEA